VPLSVTAGTAVAEFVLKDIVPEYALTAVGENVTLKEAELPGAMLLGLGPDTANCDGEMETPLMFRVALPVFVIFTA
jgi:hypothetical protein